MNGPKTSFDHPLRLDAIDVVSGRLLLTICPGKRTLHSELTEGGWHRDLAVDVETMRSANARMVVTLLEQHEMIALEVPDLEHVVRRAGMEWRHLPIPDKGIPDAQGEDAWKDLSPEIQAMLDEGGSVVIHCNGGVGRTGTIAALILMERGMPMVDAINTVRAARGPWAVENAVQEGYLARHDRSPIAPRR